MRGLTLFGSRLFLNLFASYAAILLVASAVVGVLVVDASTRNLRREQEARLETACALIEPTARQAFLGTQGGLEAELRDVRRRTGLRVTLIRPDGSVLGDSDEEAAAMENHGQRPEVLEARAEGLGVSRRYSRTVGYEMLYLATVVGDDGGDPLGVLRVSRPLVEARQEIAAMRNRVLLGAGVGLVVALLLGLFVARRLTVPLAAVTRVAEDLRAGRFDSRVRISKRDEIGILGDTLNRLAEEVTRRIATISQDDAQLRAMLSGMVEGVVAVEGDDRIAFCNRAARELLDAPAEELEGRRLWEVAPIGELERLLEVAREGEEAGRAEIELHRGGRERVIAVHAGPYECGGADGAERGVVVVVHDVTELRRLERVRRDFVANVSHELKTPLAAIKGFVETLLAGALHDADHNERFLERIDANVERLNHLVADLLSLARIEAGEQGATADVRWAEVLEEVTRRHQDVIRHKGLTFRQDVDRGVVVRGDREAMIQIVDNLIDNAAKYTLEGGVTLRVERRGDRGVLTVEDTGVGIPEDELPRVFERFYRVDKARSREVGGTGLGLSIVRNLISRMQGDVRVDSRVDEGTRFEVSLPLALEERGRAR